MSNKENTESNKRNFAPITTLICILSGTFLIMLFMLFRLYNKALNGIIEGKIPIEKLDIKMTDTFIGIIATLIGIIVTFVIGYQILNAIQIKNDIEKYQNETENEIKIQNNTISEFKDAISNISIVNDVYEKEAEISYLIEELNSYGIKLKSEELRYSKIYLDLYYRYFTTLHKYAELVKHIDDKLLYKDFQFDSFKYILNNSDIVDYEFSIGAPLIKDRGNTFSSASFGKYNVKNDCMIAYCNYVRKEILHRISYPDLYKIQFKEHEL